MNDRNYDILFLGRTVDGEFEIEIKDKVTIHGGCGWEYSLELDDRIVRQLRDRLTEYLEGRNDRHDQ